MFIYGYKMGSKTVSALCKGLGIKAIRHDKSQFKGSPDKLVINWGSSTVPAEVNKSQVLNDPAKVGVCTNKLKFFDEMSKHADVSIPEYTTDKKLVKEWLKTGNVVFARTKLQAHSGEGIVEMEDPDNIVDAPLYTKYIPKVEEYRIHLMRDKAGVVEIIDVQRKARKHAVNKDDVNWRVRNHKNGFIFARNEDKKVPATLTQQAVTCFKATGLDFGSVDIIWNKHRKLPYVLEVNTASGLEGTTLANYIDAFKKRVA